MPLHLQSITDGDQNAGHIACLLEYARDATDSVFVSKDRYLHSSIGLTDSISGERFGEVVYTMKIEEERKTLSVLDLDIVLADPGRTALRFLKLRDGSSDANEYYDAEVAGGTGHLEVETVHRHIIDGELTDTVREAGISAFPFELNVFDGIEAFNRWAGYDRERPIADTGLTVHGFSERFIMPGIITGREKDGESYTFLLGKVVEYRDVVWRLGECDLGFVIARIDTALGIIPAAMSRSVFDLSGLAPGKLVAMNADIKADLRI